jgi:hypothetical protein
MNIFILHDTNLDKCAEWHIDAHIIKMPLEAAQMLCTVHWINKFVGYVPRKLTSDEWATISARKSDDPRHFPYLPTMYNHPCTIWARTSQRNYEWLFCYALALNDEYGYRYGGKSHKSVAEVILKLPDIFLPDHGLTPFAQAMPDDLKSDNAVKSYQMFYMKDKAAIKKGCTWKHREKPEWWDEEVADYTSRISGQ